jgi:hypothetical protein
VLAGSRMDRASRARQPAASATDHGAQQIVVGGIVAAGEALVVGELGVHVRKDLGADHSGDGGHEHPLLGWAPDTGDAAGAGWVPRGMALAGGTRGVPTGIDRAGVGGVAQELAQRVCPPAAACARARHAPRLHPRGELGQRHPVLQLGGKQLADHGRLRRLQRDARRVTRPLQAEPIAGGRTRPGQEQPRLVCAQPPAAQPPAAQPLGDAGAFLLGHRPAHLQEHLVVGILAHGPLEELNATAMPLELVEQEHLVDVVAGQPIRGSHDDPVQRSRRDQIAPPVQARPAQGRPAGGLVAEDVLGCYLPAVRGVGGDVRPQALELILDGLGRRLAWAGDPCREGTPL